MILRRLIADTAGATAVEFGLTAPVFFALMFGLIDGGRTAEVALKRFAGMTDEPVVIRNLKYWGVARNDGFVLMPNVVDAYRTGDKPFEYRGTNGFMITIDEKSSDVAPASGKASGR